MSAALPSWVKLARKKNKLFREDHEDVGGIADDPLVEAERSVRALVVEQSKKMLVAVEASMNEENAPKALALLQEVATAQGTLLSSLSVSRVFVPGVDRGETGLSGAGMYGGLDSETYGANALDQMLMTVKKMQDPGGERRLDDALRALERAKEVGDAEIIASCREIVVSIANALSPPKSAEGDAELDYMTAEPPA